MGVFHASAINYKEDALLILGDSGNGKSTSLALLQAQGFHCIADDFVPVDVKKQKVYSFPAAISIKKSSLETLLEKKTKNTTLLEQAIQDEQEQKPFYDESIQKLKDLRLKLQNTLKKIKELLDTRELVLVELSNYELPKGMFESFIKQKPIQKPLLLPTGQERDKIFAQIKDLEQRIKEKKEDIQDFLNHSRDCNEKNTIFLAICDGNYYLQKDSKTGDESKIKRLQRLTDNKTSFVLNINELVELLKNIISEVRC